MNIKTTSETINRDDVNTSYVEVFRGPYLQSTDGLRAEVLLHLYLLLQTHFTPHSHDDEH